MNRLEYDEKKDILTKAWLVFSAACLAAVILASCVAVAAVALGWWW